jgi:hypothetical protein
MHVTDKAKRLILDVTDGSDLIAINFLNTPSARSINVVHMATAMRFHIVDKTLFTRLH